MLEQTLLYDLEYFGIRIMSYGQVRNDVAKSPMVRRAFGPFLHKLSNDVRESFRHVRM